jgi:ABC-2 type transport system permease protein
VSVVVEVTRDAGAIFWREWLRYRRDRGYWVGQIAFPLLFVAFLGVGLDEVASGAEAGRYSARLAAGLLALVLSSGAVGGGFTLIEDRESGFRRALCVAPLSATGVVLGKVAARWVISAFLLVVLSAAFSLFIPLAVPHPWAVLAALTSLTLCFAALGVALAAWFSRAESFRLIAALVTVPLYLLSGMFYSVERLPALARVLAYANPLTYGVDLLRYGLLGASEYPAAASAGALLALSALALPAAIYVYRAGLRR